MNALAHCMQVNCFSAITVNFLSQFEQLNSPSPTCFFCLFPVNKVWIACHSVGSWMFLHHHVFSQMQQSVILFVTLLAVEWFFSSMTSLQIISKKLLYISERGNGCCCSFKNVTQPLMFKCQTWIEKCQKSLYLKKSFDFTLEITKFPQKIA